MTGLLLATPNVAIAIPLIRQTDFRNQFSDRRLGRTARRARNVRDVIRPQRIFFANAPIAIFGTPCGPTASWRFALRLSLYTDFSIRLLMYLAAAPETRRVHTREVANAYGVSAHHLRKTVQGLTRLGHVQALPGRNGGLRLARPAADIRIGTLVAQSEETGQLVDCGRGPCPLEGKCLLKGALDHAEQVFIRELDKLSLADVVARRTGNALRHMMVPQTDVSGVST